MYADEHLKAEIVAEALTKKMVAASQVGDSAMGTGSAYTPHMTGLSGIFINQTCYRYRAKLDVENAVLADW